MEKIRPIFEFIAKKRSFIVLFGLFSIVYFCLFLGLLFGAPEEFSNISTKEKIAVGVLMSFGGGLLASLLYHFASWRTRLALNNYGRNSK